MSIERKGGKLRVKVREEPAVNRHCPSVDVLFKAVAHTCGAAAAGILLTGMGADGADGLLEIRKKGGRTFVESEESCVIYGMPKEAIARGAAETVRPLNRIHEAVFAQSLKRRRAA
jgi:two-component system chemotaxis response regulator CheB